MKKVIIIFLLGFIILLYGCSSIYQTPDAITIAESHKTIAIIPSKVSIKTNKRNRIWAVKEQQKTASIDFQRELYRWMLERKMQRRISAEIIDIETVNAKLSKAGYFNDSALTLKEICTLLKVDGLITSNFDLSQPLSQGDAIAAGIVFGVWVPTNNVRAEIEIFDALQNKMIWNYFHKLSGGAFSNAERIVDGIMMRATKKLPYNVK